MAEEGKAPEVPPPAPKAPASAEVENPLVGGAAEDVPTATPANEGAVAVPEKKTYGATDPGAGEEEEAPLTSKGLKAKLAEKKEQEAAEKQGYFGTFCSCCYVLARCIGDIVRTIPVFTLGGLALATAGLIIIKVYSIKFENDIDIGSTAYYMDLVETYVLIVDISASVLSLLLSGALREYLCLWCASSDADEQALEVFKLKHEEENKPKPLPAEVFAHVHKAHSVIDGELGDDDVFCKMYLVGDKLPFAVAANFDEEEEEKSFPVPGLESGDEMVCRLVLEMVKTEGEQVIGAVEIVLHSTDLGMAAQTYDFLDSGTHEVTAKVKVSFTKLGQTESSSSEDEDDVDPTLKNRTWTECCIDCLGYCGLETLLWIFLILLYLCFVITFLICVVFSIIVTVMFLFDKLCASDSTIIAVLDELSDTLSEFGVDIVDDSLDDTIDEFCDEIDSGLGDMEWMWIGTFLLFFGQTHILLAMTDRHRSAVDAVQVASLKQQVHKLTFMNQILSQQHHRDQHHRHHHGEGGLDTKYT